MQDSKISVSGLNLFYGENHALKDINIKIRENTVTGPDRALGLRQVYIFKDA